MLTGITLQKVISLKTFQGKLLSLDHYKERTVCELS